MKMNQLSTQIAFFCTMMCSLLLYDFYSACVVSVRLNEPIFKMNDSLNELSKTKAVVSSEWMDFFVYYIKVIICILQQHFYLHYYLHTYLYLTVSYRIISSYKNFNKNNLCFLKIIQKN